MIIYYKIILPENEFSHLKGVNNQPYLDIRTFASHLTKRFLFSCISLFFLLKYVFYIHPISHFQVAFCLCVKTSLNAKPFIWFAPTELIFTRRLILKQRHKDTYIHELLTGAFDFKFFFPLLVWYGFGGLAAPVPQILLVKLGTP